jgi:hypothetical protein
MTGRTDPQRRARGIPHTAQRAAFPLGGIGTGNVSLGARGELRDWEFENAPDKGRINPYSFFAIHAAPLGDDGGDAGEAVTRVLEARITGRRDIDAGFLFEWQAGLPRLRGATMRGEYPVVDIDFDDDVLPVDVSLRAFTPLVPLDPDASGIPAAVLRYRVTNPSDRRVRVTIAGSVSHTAGRGEGPFGMRAQQTVRWREERGARGLDFGIRLPEDDPDYGTLSLTTTDESTTAKPQWVTGFWPDGARLFWNDLSDDGMLAPEPRLTLEDRPRGLFADSAVDGAMDEEELFERLPRLRTGSLGIVHELAPGESRDFEFVLAWSFPNRRRSWRGNIVADDRPDAGIVRNRYAVLWPDAWAAASHLHRELPALEATTLAFVEALYGGTLDPVIADAVGANIAAARSTTAFVVETPTGVRRVGGLVRPRGLVRGDLHARVVVRADPRVAVPVAGAQRAPRGVPARDRSRRRAEVPQQPRARRRAVVHGAGGRRAAGHLPAAAPRMALLGRRRLPARIVAGRRPHARARDQGVGPRRRRSAGR